MEGRFLDGRACALGTPGERRPGFGVRKSGQAAGLALDGEIRVEMEAGDGVRAALDAVLDAQPEVGNPPGAAMDRRRPKAAVAVMGAADDGGAIFLGDLEPERPRPPRDPRQSLLTRELVVRTVLLSALLVVGSWWVFQHELSLGSSAEVSRTAALNVFVAVETIYLFSCRSLTRPAWRLGFFSNRWLLVGVAVQWAAQMAITYLAVMNELFGTAPLDPASWGRILLVALAAAAVVSADKLRSRGRGF